MAEKTVHVCDSCGKVSNRRDLYRIVFESVEKHRGMGEYPEKYSHYLKLEWCKSCCRRLPDALQELVLAQPTVEAK